MRLGVFFNTNRAYMLDPILDVIQSSYMILPSISISFRGRATAAGKGTVSR